VALVPARLVERLPEAAWQRHLAAVEAANESLTAAGLPALRSGLEAGSRADERPPGVSQTPSADPVPTPPARRDHAVPATARLDAQGSASTSFPGRSARSVTL
jgi:hypothetical protein